MEKIVFQNGRGGQLCQILIQGQFDETEDHYSDMSRRGSFATLLRAIYE